MPTVKIDSQTHKALRELSGQLDVTMGALLRKAIRKMQVEAFWEGVRKDFDRLKADKAAWEDYQAEARSLDVGWDGLTDETEVWAKLYPELNLRKRSRRRK